MKRPSASDLSALTLDLYRSCRELPVDRYQLWALDQLRAVIPFDAGKWVSGHMAAQGPVIHNVLLAGRPPEMLSDYDRIKQEDVLTYESVANPNSARLANDVARRPDLSSAMVAYLRKWKIAHAAGICTIDTFTDLATGIGLWREASDAPFSEAERTFFEAVMPHLIETYATNRISHVVRMTHPRNNALFASAIADANARLHVAPENFTRMVLREWPGWRGSVLPPELEQFLKDGTESRFTARRITFRVVRFESLYLVQARDKHATDELTRREFEVARLVAEGLSYAGVAERLAISPGTVRTHVSSVFGKLKLRKQAELALALRHAD